MGEAGVRARPALVAAFGLLLILGGSLSAAGVAAGAPYEHVAPGDPGACRTCHGAQVSGTVAGSPGGNDVCYSCHTDPQGPVFNRALFEQEAHGPFWTAKSRTPYARGQQASARRGLCANCHDVHGKGTGRASTWLGTPQDSTALCASCHLDTLAYGAFPGLRVYADSPHGNPLTGVARAKSVFATGECLNCHDPHGQGNQKLLNAPRGSEFCLASGCHDGARVGGLWPGQAEYRLAGGIHGSPPAAARPGVRRTYPGRDAAAGSCTTCHNPHGALDPRTGRLTSGMTNAEGAELCYQCHDGLRYEFASLSHHPVDSPGSGLTCQSCHNPHVVTRFQPVTSPDRPQEPTVADNDFCLACHDGSFGLAANIKLQLNGGSHQTYAAGGSCLSCHSPHGSSKQGLLRN